MATVQVNKGSVFEHGSYLLVIGTVNADGGGATYSATDFQLVEILQSMDLEESIDKIRIGGGVTGRNDYSNAVGSVRLSVFLPRGGRLTTIADLGLPIKFTRQPWVSTTAAVAVECALISRRETGRNGQGVFEELVLDMNPHWLVESLD